MRGVKGPEEAEPQPEVERQPSTRARVGEDNNKSDPQYRSDENYHDSAPNQNWYANSGEKVEMPESSGSGPAPTPGTHFMAGDETAQMPERYEPKMSATPGTHYMAGDEAVKMPERRERKTSATPGTHYMAGDEAVTMPERREQKISVTPGSHFMAGEEKVADIHSNVSSQPSVAAPSGWFQAGGEKVQDGSDLRRIPQKSPNNKLAAPTGWFGCGAEAVSGSSNRSFASQKSDFKAQNFNGFEAVINSSPSASVYSRKSDVDGAGKEETPRSDQYARQQELMSRVALKKMFYTNNHSKMISNILTSCRNFFDQHCCPNH